MRQPWCISELQRVRVRCAGTHASDHDTPAMLVMRQIRAQEKAFHLKAQRPSTPALPPPSISALPPAPLVSLLSIQRHKEKEASTRHRSPPPRIQIVADNTTRPVEVMSVGDAQRRITLRQRILDALREVGGGDGGGGGGVENQRMRIDLMGNRVDESSNNNNKLMPSITDRNLEVMLLMERRRRDDDGGAHEEEDAARRTRMRYVLAAIGAALVSVGACVAIGVTMEQQRADASAMWRHLKDQLRQCDKLIREPSRDKLLPDVLRPPYYQPPYTLVLEFTDVLVHPEWTYATGWRFKKRPGVDEFLDALYTRFEVVVYTAQLGMTVFPVLDALDERNLISYKLVRDATHFVDGHHVKDLSRLNRDLAKVVAVDWNVDSLQMHARNLFHVPRWDGDDGDRTLYDLAAFLIAISEWEVGDVRAVLDYYAQFDNPLAKFKENQQQALKASTTVAAH